MKLYNELAEWWPLMQPPRRYAREAARIARRLRPDASEARRTDAGSAAAGAGARPNLLFLGSGGGHLASHLKQWFDMTLVDLSPQMLDLSRALNPECRHVEADMRNVRLDERFDAVLIYDAVVHVLHLEELLETLRTARTHMNAGGAAVFCPDWFLETYASGTITGGTSEDGRGMRYIEWNQPEVDGTICRSDVVYLLRRENGEVSVEHDHVRLGVFSEADWRQVLGEAGFGEIAIRRRPSNIIITARAD
jgi:SAM-dependent methyltransferase